MAEEQAGRGETMMRVSWGVGLAVGMGSGIALGSAMQNMGVGIAIGLALGVVIMGAFSVAGARMRRDAATEEPVPEEHIDGSNRPGDGATPGRAADGGPQPRSGPEA